MPQNEEKKTEVVNPFGQGSNFLQADTTTEVVNTEVRENKPKGEIHIPLPQVDDIPVESNLPKVESPDTKGTAFLNPTTVAPNTEEKKVDELPSLDTKEVESKEVKKVESGVYISKKKVVGCVTSFLLFLLICGFLSLIGLSVGRNTPFSNFATYIPVESIPVFNLLVKPEERLVYDGLSKLESNDFGSKISITTTGDITYKTEIDFTAERGIFKKQTTLSDGTVDMYEILAPSLEEIYFKYESEKKTTSDLKGVDPIFEIAKSAEGKYIFFKEEKNTPKPSDPDFLNPKKINIGISKAQSDTLKIELNELEQTLKKSLPTLLSDGFKNILSFTTVKHDGKVKVGTREAYKLKVSSDGPSLTKELRSIYSKFKEDNKDKILTLNTHYLISLLGLEYSSDVVDTLKKQTSESKDESIGLSTLFLDDFFSKYTFENPYIYVDIESNRIVRVDLTLNEKTSGKNFQTSIEITPNTVEPVITPPSNFEKYLDYLNKSLIEYFTQQREQYDKM